MESERLCYIVTYQTHLRSDRYILLGDGIRNDSDPKKLGKVFMLPSAFIGSPRYMNKRMQDAMIYMHHFGRSDLFVTFTYNPKCSKITRELLPGQRTSDRHDLIARVFQLKVTLLIRLIHSGKALGDMTAYVSHLRDQREGCHTSTFLSGF